MATYESIIKITGAVGDLVFYNLNGKNVVRKKSGFNKTAFKKSPSYEKVRQNSSEFGHCSKVGKIIRHCLDTYIKEAGDPLLYQKFTKLMTEIKDLDMVSERGKRTVENGLITEEGKRLLREFQFGKKDNVAEVDIRDKNLYLHDHYKTDQIEILTIKLNSENYTADSIENTILLHQQQEIKIERQEPCGFLLYFIALKKEDGEIVRMGFV